MTQIIINSINNNQTRGGKKGNFQQDPQELHTAVPAIITLVLSVSKELVWENT